MKNVIKIDFLNFDGKAWTGFIWLGIGKHFGAFVNTTMRSRV
jgi:hypothetical protein